MVKKGRADMWWVKLAIYVIVINEVVSIVSVFDKGQLDNLTKDQIIELLKKAGLL